MLVTTAPDPLTTMTFPMAALLPISRALPPKFHKLFAKTLTVLFDEPAPMVRP